MSKDHFRLSHIPARSFCWLLFVLDRHPGPGTVGPCWFLVPAEADMLEEDTVSV